MKIVHICLAGSYNDNWGYQDNLIPKYHYKQGHDVTVITSIFVNKKDSQSYSKVTPGSYYLENGVKVIRIPFMYSPFSNIIEKLRIYKGLNEKLEKENPEFIFIHGAQFMSIRAVVNYLKKNKNSSIKVVVDNHADFSNSARNFLSKNILHKIIWKRCLHLIEPYTTKFYGVLPARADFLIDVYKVPRNKVELLVMGADDEKLEESKSSEVKESIRNKLGIEKDDFLIITGGKIDNAKKQTLLLMEAVKDIPNKKVKLIVFGSVIAELQDEINRLVDKSKIQYIGWIESEDSYKYFSAADLVIFPGRHSVFWEQVVAQGIPMIVKWWEGTTHIDLGGNVKFLQRDSAEEIKECICNLLNDKEAYNRMLQRANDKSKNQFLYSNIAKKSLL